MSFLNVTWKSISSIGKGQSTPGCEDSTQDLPRGASPSPTLPKDFDSSKHISCEIPTIFPQTPLDESITPPPPLYDDKRSSGEMYAIWLANQDIAHK
ncbi:hypothetical protein BU17DRAFT_97409 [Hysterangium stoloniferum]|nr:hypothetical protein BU17DRAFT_97409 [Hysterangium stoloniferum]